jgi:hypothetical protein
MQGIGYTFRVWLSGILLTPVIYSLPLILFSGFQLPQSLGSIILTFVIPYTFLISVWVALGIFGTIVLTGNYKSLKLYLSFVGFVMPFAGLAMVHHISALMSYSDSYLLALAYAIGTLIFVWLYNPNLSDSKPNSVSIQKTIKDAAIYALTVWLFTFLLSTPVSMVVWIITKDFKPISPIKTALNIIDRYNIQLSLSMACFVTVFLTSLIAIHLNITENRKKAIILLLAFPLVFPVLFYYQLFSGDIFTHGLLEIFTLIAPSIVVSSLSIWLIDIIPVAKNKG